MGAEEWDVDGCQYEPRDEESDTGSSQEYTDVVDADGENTADDSNHNRQTGSRVGNPGLVDVFPSKG